MTTDKSYPNTGALFAQKSDNPKGPNYTGSIELDETLIAHLSAALKAGKPAVLRLAGWKQVSKKNGKGFLSLKLSAPLQQKREQHGEEEDEALPF